MAKKKQEEVNEGLPAWMGTYGDMVTLLLCFFVLMFSMSSVDVAKFKAAMSSFSDQIDILPGGTALTEGDLLNNGISQLNDIQVVFSGAMAYNSEGKETIELKDPEDSSDSDASDDDNNTGQVDPYEEAGKVAQQIEALISEEGIEASVNISFSANYVKFSLQGEFLFDSGRANLRPEAKEAIRVIAAIGLTEEYKDYDIEIDGHTDNLAINSVQFPDNYVLSFYRAKAVLEELTEIHGYEKGRAVATGHGDDHPIEDNATVEGRAANRRVEIKVLLNTEELTTEEYTTEDIEEGQLPSPEENETEVESEGETGTDQ